MTAQIAFAALSAGAQLMQARSQARGYAAQAAQAKMQAASERLKYKQQAVAVLDNLLRTQATINARAAAGNIDPFSGNAAALRYQAISRGANEYYLSQEGQTIVTQTGEMQARNFMDIASSTMRSGIMSAAATVGFAAFQGAQLGGAPLDMGTTAQTNLATSYFVPQQPNLLQRMAGQFVPKDLLGRPING